VVSLQVLLFCGVTAGHEALFPPPAPEEPPVGEPPVEEPPVEAPPLEEPPVGAPAPGLPPELPLEPPWAAPAAPPAFAPPCWAPPLPVPPSEVIPPWPTPPATEIPPAPANPVSPPMGMPPPVEMPPPTFTEPPKPAPSTGESPAVAPGRYESSELREPQPVTRLEKRPKSRAPLTISRFIDSPWSPSSGEQSSHEEASTPLLRPAGKPIRCALLRSCARQAQAGHRIARRASSAVHRARTREGTLRKCDVTACETTRRIARTGEGERSGRCHGSGCGGNCSRSHWGGRGRRDDGLRLSNGRPRSGRRGRVRSWRGSGRVVVFGTSSDDREKPSEGNQRPA
jgi:hypothetical protein